MLAGELDGLVLLGLGLVLLLGLLGWGLWVGKEWVLTDLVVGLLVDLLEGIGLNLVIKVTLELRLVALLIILSQLLHVLGNVSGVDVLAEGLGVELLGLNIVTWEAVWRVWDVESSIGSTLHGTEDTSTSGGSLETDIENDLEWTSLLSILISSLGGGVLASSLSDTLEHLIETQLLEGTTGAEKTGSVGGSPVGETVLDSVSLELVGVSGNEDLITDNLGGDNLDDDVAVGEADYETVLWSIVLVLGLGDEALAGVVIGLSLTTSAVLRLEAGEVGVGLDGLGERLQNLLENRDTGRNGIKNSPL